MNKLKKNDTVIVLKGRDKGKKGKVLTVLNDERVIVENLNMVTKHQKGVPSQGVASGIIQKSMPIQISNIGILNPNTNRADRIGFRYLADGRKVRYYKSTNELVDI